MYKKSLFKKLISVSLSLLLVLLLVASAASCGCLEMLTKEELYENVHNDRSEKDSVTRYIYEWGFPEFNTNKFMYVESLVFMNLYEATPGKLTVATDCADKFLENYYDSIDLNDPNAVTDALLRCFMRSLGDEYAVYRVPSEQDVFDAEISGGGTFVGIGVQVRNTEEKLPYISAVYKDSGAEAAGIQVGDVIVKVDDNNADELGYEKTVDALKGESGSFVSVTVRRGDAKDAEYTFSVERKVLPAVSVYYSFNAETGYAYVSILSFQKTTGVEFKAVIDELEKQGVRGIIFDLRNNLGGVLDAVCEVVSYLVEDGIPFISYNRYNTEKEIRRTLVDSHTLNVPMVVLTNQLTASAAEIFAAALRDYRDNPELGASNKNITIVGKNTFGKGVMQSSYMLNDGSSVTFTTAYYNPPSGVNYHGVGISPDEGYEEDAYFSIYGDRQLGRAYEALDEYFADAAA